MRKIKENRGHLFACRRERRLTRFCFLVLLFVSFVVTALMGTPAQVLLRPLN